VALEQGDDRDDAVRALGIDLARIEAVPCQRRRRVLFQDLVGGGGATVRRGHEDRLLGRLVADPSRRLAEQEHGRTAQEGGHHGDGC
jgi:hypothetical protein